MGPPFVVVEGQQRAARVRVGAALAAARAEGWVVLRGWGAPMRREHVVCTGWIRSADDARRALLAAVSGAHLAVAISADRDTVDRFLDDLRRLGPVDHVTAPHLRPTGLTAEQRALLGLLAEGLTVREAAVAQDIAPRTAARRLRAVRTQLGVDSTAAAIHAAVHGGVPARR